MNIDTIDGEEILISKSEDYKNLDTFITEILAAEQRILIKQREPNEAKSAVNLYKESILIRELFSYITRYYYLGVDLTNEQHIIARRIWNKAFTTALSAAKNIQKRSIIKRIDTSVTHALSKLKAPN